MISNDTENLDRQLHLSARDLALINNALNEILNGPSAIEAWEFPVRTGATIMEAEALLSRINKALDENEHKR